MKNGEKEIQSFVLKKAFWKIIKVSKAVFFKYRLWTSSIKGFTLTTATNFFFTNLNYIVTYYYLYVFYFLVQASVYFLTPGEGGRTKPILNKYMNMIFMDTWNMFYR